MESIRIHNPDSEGVGELVTRGRNVCMGYIWDEEKTRQNREVIQRSYRGHTEVIQRSCRGHAEVIQRSYRGQTDVIQTSFRGHSEVI